MDLSRRQLLLQSSQGFGYLALAALAQAQAPATVNPSPGPLNAKAPMLPARAKRVIFLCMQGAPSHVDLFDPKPKLTQDSGKSAPPAAGRGGQAKLMASPWSFKAHGQSGLPISELLPQLAGHADELCMINSMCTDVPAHPQAFTQLHTGSAQFVRPSMGSWVLYGLGSENENLPGFITINPPPAAARSYGSAFLPAIYQATKLGGTNIPGLAQIAQRLGIKQRPTSLPNIKNPRLQSAAQRAQLDFIQAINRQTLQQNGGHNAELEAAIESYELAFRMQAEVPRLLDLNAEPEATRKLYGLDEPETDTFGRQCLMARKLVQAGVRFVEITHGNWDQHFNLKAQLERNCRQIDQPIAALLKDLKTHGLLKDTLVIWGGEFGRTPHSQGDDGRDHNHKGFSMWMAGGGVKGGLRYGRTDDYGYEAVEDKMPIHDWHATVLHLLGLDHERLTFRHAGRDFRLTDVHGQVAHKILA